MKRTFQLLSIFLVIFHADANAVPLIVRGNKAKEGQFPYVITIQNNTKKENSVNACGGSIMSSRWILTCNHCIPKNIYGHKVVVGTIRLDKGTRYDIGWAVKHVKSDVALIKVKKNIKFNSKTKPIPIGTDFIKGGVDVVVSGWGRTETGYKNELMYVKMKTITNQKCREIWHNNKIGNDRLCTTAPRGHGTCFGDSGSGVIHKGKIVGMVSLGTCSDGRPELAVRVAYYKKWIDKYIKGKAGRFLNGEPKKKAPSTSRHFNVSFSFSHSRNN